MRYLFWFCFHELFLYPFVIALALPFYLLFDGELWAVAALAIALCLLSSILTSYLGRSLITLTAAKASVFASKGQLDKSLNRLIYISRLLPAVRNEVRDLYATREASTVALMELALKCMRLDEPSLKPFLVVKHVLYIVSLVLAIASMIIRVIG